MRPDEDSRAALGRRVAAVLRIGTLVAVVAVALGYAIALVAGTPGPGAQPLGEVIAAGDADALSSVGLLGLTLLPLGVLGVAAHTFHVSGERRYLIACLVTLVLLVASLVIAAVVAPTS